MNTKICYYDNPDTMCREKWVNGVLSFSVTASTVSRRNTYIPAELREVVRKPFKAGAVDGDVSALGEVLFSDV